MLIVMHHDATDDQIRRVCDAIQEMGYQARPMPGRQRTTVGLVGNDGRVDGSRISALPGVQEVIHVTKPYKQVSREWRSEPTVVRLSGGLVIGGEDVVVMAGPCSVESERQILAAAEAVRDAGATVLRPFLQLQQPGLHLLQLRQAILHLGQPHRLYLSRRFRRPLPQGPGPAPGEDPE